MAGPRFLLLYWKSVLNDCLLEFFRRHNVDFSKGGGKYVLGKAYSKSALADEFRELAVAELSKYAPVWDPMRPEYLFVIGGCEPEDSLLLKTPRGKRISLSAWSRPRGLKYFLAENDIDVDMKAFIGAFDSVFARFFSGEDEWLNGRRNVVFVKHKLLDCYTVFKALKFIYGPSACVNTYKEKGESARECLLSLNELVDADVTDKTSLNGMPEFKKAVKELKAFLEEKIGKLS